VTQRTSNGYATQAPALLCSPSPSDTREGVCTAMAATSTSLPNARTNPALINSVTGLTNPATANEGLGAAFEQPSSHHNGE
jgi:hypothetical protein